MKLQVGVKALIRNNDGLYFFLQRSDRLPTGEINAWDIPGGRLSADEDMALAEALNREILEETQLKLTGIPRLLQAQDILKPELNLHVIRLTFEVTATGKIKLSDEHKQFKWLSVETALNLKTDRYLAEVLQGYKI